MNDHGKIAENKKIVINPEYTAIKSFIEEIPSRFQQEGKTIYKNRNEIKVVKLDHLTLNVKEYKVPFFLNRIVYSLFRKPKCVRAYNYALKLREKGIETPEPVAYVIESRGGLISKSYFVSIQSFYERNLYEFGSGGIEGREAILTAFARFTARLHESGICHRDYSPGNILFHEQEGNYFFTLVDINRMTFENMSFEKGCKNFARLWGQKDFFEFVATEYAKVRNYPIEKTIARVLHYRSAFWKRAARKRPVPFRLD